jgi:mannose-6-phosphate isomerase-like protein (cupin superfamily)
MEMPENASVTCYKELIGLGRTLPPGKWHELTRIRDTTVYLVRAVPREGEFDTHADADELVVVLDGVFRIETPQGITEAKAGESLMVPRGTPHRGRLNQEAVILLIR